MKSLKKILYLFLIIFTLSFSIEGEKSKVVLDKRYDTAELKIGVTKLISKELPLEFHAEGKKIYGEIDIDENDLVFISETLDEMPSVSTTNGRKSINNIKRYLTKEIKKAPKFEYRIVEEKPEADKTEGKKYLLIDCKEQLSSVYVYVVEKGSYKVKEVYKGVFKQLLNAQAKAISYGTILVEKNMFAQDMYRRISYKGGKPVISQLSQGNFDKEDTEASKYIKVSYGEYPKKLADGTKYDQNILPSVKPYYEIKIYENGVEKASSNALPLKGNKKNEIDAELSVNSATANDATKLHIMSDSSSEYLYIDVRQPYPYEKVNYKIAVTYGEYATLTNDFWDHEIHEFYLVIEPQVKPVLPENTKGTLYLKKIKSEGAVRPTTVTFDGKTGMVDDTSIFTYHGFNGEQVKIVDYFNEEYKNAFPEENENFLRISYTSNAEKNPASWTKDVKINSQKGIVLDNNSLGEVGIYDRYNMHLGNLAVIGENKKGEDKYFSLKFLPINNYEWVNTHREVISTLTFEYITKIPNGAETLLKKDILNIVMYPIDEVIPSDTFGTLVIRNPHNLPNNDLFIRNGHLEQEIQKETSGVGFDLNNASISGQLPTGFAMNTDELKNWVNIERGIRLQVVNSRETIETVDPADKSSSPETPFVHTTGAFRTKYSGRKGWVPLYGDSSNTHIVGRIYLSYGGIHDDKDKDSITIGFRHDYLGTDKSDFDWRNDDKGIYEKYEFQYQIELDEGNWVTIKTDVLELIIQRDLSADKKPRIILSNPLVYYDYDESSALSNVVHNRRAHLAKGEAKTLNSSGTNFTKNTNLMGKEWIIGENQIDYEWEVLGEHKISINRGTDEVLKNTYKNGGTKSSTFLSGDNTGEASRTKNEVMFSYDGGNKYLNFGLSKYNFDGEIISDIAVTHFEKEGGFLKNRHTYVVEIPAFEGIHYVGNYDIKPKQSYTKNYAYDPTKPNTAEIIVDYGTVGFRNLDTRITNQSGGEGIDIRAVKKVKLVSEDESYVIKGAELFFEKEKEEPNDDNERTSRFKGENERATSAMLKLRIPVQETLIPKGRFKILTDDGKDVDNYPLRVGVTVNGNAEKYYTPIDDEPKGKDGKNLYLNITTNRFIETVIEFENPDLKNDNQGKNWIRLDDSNYAGGVLSREIISENGSTSNLWGRVKGDIIDIPTDRYPHLKMVLFDEKNNDKPLLENLNTLNGEKKFSFGQGKNFIISRENPTDNYIRFTLDNGYDPVADAKTEIKFYIRYFDTSVEGKEDFLFDQRYIVRFKEKAEYKADTTVIFKNPAMAADKTNTDNGMINMSQRISKGNDNSNTAYDEIEWYKVLNPIDNYPGTVLMSLTRIEDDKPINDYSKFLKIEETGGKKVLYFGIPNERAKFEELFGGYDGSRIEKSFALKFAQDNSNSYRLNVVIEKFDPKYFGKVYPASLGNEDYTTYKEINAVGTGNIDLTKSNLQADNVYVDLGTSYRDYLRYEALPKTLLNKELEVKAEGVVEAVPKDSLYAEKIKGELVLSDNGNYTNLSTGSKKIEFTADGKNMPKSYSLKLKLYPGEYKKLKPYTEYEIFFNGEQNVLTIGADTLKDNIIFDRPLNFNTTGPSLKIETTVLDFGQIKPKEAKEDLIKKEGKTETPVRVIMSGEFDSELALQKTLVVDKDIIWLKQQSINGGAMENGGQLRVRDLKAVKHTAETPPAGEGQEIIEEYDITGILEVPKDIDESKYGEYIEYLGVTYTFY